jgi:D-amino-acid dehydrogenase
MLKLMKSYLGRTAECEEVEQKEVTNKKILIVGAGMVGTSTAYFLSKRGGYDITVVEKDFPIRGATEQNANTITFIPYPAFTTYNLWKVLKDNITMAENPLSYFKFTLLFDSHFRFWAKNFMKNRKKDRINQSNGALARLITYSISLYDNYINEVTNNNPKEVDYHQEVLTNVYRNLDAVALSEKEKLLAEIKHYDPSCERVSDEELKKYKDASIVYKLAVRTLNTAKFCDMMHKQLAEKYGVKYIQGEVKSVTYTDDSIKTLEVVGKDSKTHKLEHFDSYVFCGGCESVNLGKLVGVKVPIFGFKGHTLNVYCDETSMPENTFIYSPENICISRVGYGTTGMVRFSGFADVVGLNKDTLEFRKKQLIEITKKTVGEKYYDESRANHWVGLRPVCADDVPLIGKSSKFNNLYWNTGHGARGITLSAASANLITSLISGDEVPGKLIASDYSP